MRSIHIKASREYDVLVERGLLDRAGELLREVSAPGTRYASTVLTIGFNRYAIPHPYSTGFRIDSIFNTVSEIAVTRSIAK